MLKAKICNTCFTKACLDCLYNKFQRKRVKELINAKRKEKYDTSRSKDNTYAS